MKTYHCPACGTKFRLVEDEPSRSRTVSDHQAIANALARALGWKPEILFGKGRARPLVDARTIIARILRERLDWTLVEIGEVLGGRDHSSVVHMLRRPLRVDPAPDGFERVVENVLTCYGIRSVDRPEDLDLDGVPGPTSPRPIPDLSTG